MEDVDEVAPNRNRASTQHYSLSELICALEAARTLGMKDVCVTTVAEAGADHLLARFRYCLDATARSPRDVLARTASLRSTRTAS